MPQKQQMRLNADASTPRRKSIHGDEMLRQRGCARKTKFATEAGAMLAMETMRRTQGKKHTKKLNTYHCRFCHCWHVGRNRFFNK